MEKYRFGATPCYVTYFALHLGLQISWKESSKQTTWLGYPAQRLVI